MRVEAGGSVFLLDRHLQRLHESARCFGFQCDIVELREVVQQQSAGRSEPARLRLLADSDGAHELQFGPLPREGSFKRARLSSTIANSADPFLRHKTTVRRVYDEARHGHAEDSEVILANERGELTETSIANIALWRNGRWVTPNVSCGLLPGTMRAELLENGDLIEGILTVDELLDGEQIRCFNSVRGIYDLPFKAGRLA
jgi:para-aminobenzoate synthetase/4-amino-4-deoxychorismate lyase